MNEEAINNNPLEFIVKWSRRRGGLPWHALLLVVFLPVTAIFRRKHNFLRSPVVACDTPRRLPNTRRLDFAQPQHYILDLLLDAEPTIQAAPSTKLRVWLWIATNEFISLYTRLNCRTLFLRINANTEVIVNS